MKNLSPVKTFVRHTIPLGAFAFPVICALEAQMPKSYHSSSDGLERPLGLYRDGNKNESNGYCLAGNWLESMVLLHSWRGRYLNGGEGAFCSS